MGSNTNAAKSAQLGMPHGTARARLVKNLMFDMMHRLGEDKCFRCGVSIDSTDELSIEHKEPWLFVDVELFWDLNNIAFSHLSCNRPDRPKGFEVGHPPYGNSVAKTEGDRIRCGSCDRFLPTSEFSPDNGLKYRARPYRRQCRDCRRTK